METQLHYLLDVLIAAVLAGLVGLEREMDSKPAGLRTHMIIGAAAALFVVMGKVAIEAYFVDVPANVRITTDPIRVFEAIVVGVSFIGAGTIMRSENGGVRYLTSAATLLLSAGIGITVGFHQYYLAVGLAALAWVVNHVLARFETHVLGTREKKEQHE